ncbi:MAG: threonine--tRNA ligase [Alphaproteobacteria bacterium]|uniref:Threonine--tRNA ligase n=1 Tax=Candidatus Nitrobium versatile TaxID=2884831 RepID=A0A953J8N8_9BACT|nr:threonine--tRNA ligase [Candidatus Nitrobium versatile]
MDAVKAVALRVNGEVRDRTALDTLDPEAVVELIPAGSKEGLEIYRHSTSHIMAHAVKELFPEVKFAIGPATEEGFYYDFDRETPFTPEDLEKIEKKMKEIIKQNNPFVRKDIPREEALALFRNRGEEYKAQLIEGLQDPVVSLYEEGGFMDLCRGPHLATTGAVKAFKLLNIAGAYWRGDEKNKMLQRIYGTAFYSKEELKEHLDFLEEVKRRDHRKLGKELDLFSVSDDIGPGLILWHPNGAIIRKTMEDFWREEHLKADYKILFSPHIAKLHLWQRSGHWDFYRENMYSPMEIDEVSYEVKPMNCPFHIGIYKSALRSYRDLPLRYAELGTVYRYERSGVLHGLLRVRGFTQDDAHIFCREDQIEDEILNILDFTLFILKTFGFDAYDIYLSTRPEKYVGSLENWERATGALKQALEKKGLAYRVDPGEGVFYGPKIDIKIKDSLNRSWQCSTIQVDFNLPERFDTSYRGSDGREHRPIMIHRALMGSLERFFGVLIEHYAGIFPLWLAPVQVEVLTIAERHDEYAGEVYRALKKANVRVELNRENEKIGYKIRQATLKKVPYLVIIGDKEKEEGMLTVRKRSGENIGPFTLDAFMVIIKEEIENKGQQAADRTS